VDFFPLQEVRPNPQCDDSHCRQRQKDYQQQTAANAGSTSAAAGEEAAKVDEVTHESNEFGSYLNF
jgi:ubiquitin-like modifier-activating enzyme 5